MSDSYEYEDEYNAFYGEESKEGNYDNEKEKLAKSFDLDQKDSINFPKITELKKEETNYDLISLTPNSMKVLKKSFSSLNIHEFIKQEEVQNQLS